MIPGVILAAGASSRMGRPKALLPTAIPGCTFLSRLVDTLRAGGIDDVLVVVGADAPAVRAALSAERYPPRLVDNPAPERGQLSSLAVAIGVVDRPGVRAMLATPVDVPLVSSDTVRALLDAYRRTRGAVVRPLRNGCHGHPVIFDRALFDELRGADPAGGAKSVIKAHLTSVVNVPIDDAGAYMDIDTPEEYARVIGRPLQ